MTGNWAQFGSPVEQNPLLALSKSPGLGSFSPVNNNNLLGLASILPHHVPNSPKIAPIGKDQGKTNHTNPIFTNTGAVQGAVYQHSRSFTEQKVSASPGPVSAFGESNSSSSGVGTLTGPQFLWGSPTPYSERASSAWPTSSVAHPFSSSGQGFPYTSRHGSFLGSSNHHHVGSAPSGVHLDRPFSYLPESPETSFMSPVSFAGVGLNRSNGSLLMNIGARGTMGAGVGLPGNVTENGSPSFRMMSMPRHGPIFLGNGSYPGQGTVGNEALADHSQSPRVENNGNQIDNKKQYQLDLDKITNGEDIRTTLMIKNIPNK